MCKTEGSVDRQTFQLLWVGSVPDLFRTFKYTKYKTANYGDIVVSTYTVNIVKRKLYFEYSTLVIWLPHLVVGWSLCSLVDELVLHKNGKSRNNNYLHTVLNSMMLLCTKYYQNWSMSVEDIANQTSVIFEHD